MVIESIVICVDNSDYMRNEDFEPDRLKAQVDALQVVMYAKLRASPENYLGLVTLANNRVLTNLTNQEAKLLGDLSKMEVKGSIKLLPSLNVSQLVLKHRPIKHAKCRIIAFIGSPVYENETEMVNLGKKFKKENVSVDIVSFGSEPGVEVLKILVDSLNGPNGMNNSFHTVPPNLVLSDYVVSCGLVAVQREYGVMQDADEDEELRRAIEWSMLESEGRASNTPQIAQPTGIQDGNNLSDDEQLRIAIQLSLQEAQRLEAALEEHQQTDSITRTNSPDSTEPGGSSNSPESNYASPNTADSTDLNTQLQSEKESTQSKNSKDDPPGSNTNNKNAPPNSNHNNAAASATPQSNSETGKPSADNKEPKKTILTKKR